MFTKNQPPDAAPRKRRGRPPGQTEQGQAARKHLYDAAIRLIALRGYEATTLRDIALRAGVSAGLLYRYFPSKRAVVLALYDELSADFATRAQALPDGTWRERFLFALKTSLEVLRPHRATLMALVPVLLGGSGDGMFTQTADFSRERVQGAFERAVVGATDAPVSRDAAALGRLLYVVHLLVLLWWLLDKSPGQSATERLLALLEEASPMLAFAFQLPLARDFVSVADSLIQQGLFGDRSLNFSK